MVRNRPKKASHPVRTARIHLFSVGFLRIVLLATGAIVVATWAIIRHYTTSARSTSARSTVVSTSARLNEIPVELEP